MSSLTLPELRKRRAGVCATDVWRPLLILLGTLLLFSPTVDGCGVLTQPTASTSGSLSQTDSSDKTCTWTITCPTAGSALTASINPQQIPNGGSLSISSDGLQSGDTDRPWVLTASTGGFTVLRQDTFTMIVKNPNNGQINVQVSNIQCTPSTQVTMFGCPPRASLTLGATGTVRFGTDVDGDASAQYLTSATCSWTFTCPAGMSFALSRWEGYITDGASLKVFSPSTASNPALTVSGTLQFSPSSGANTPYLANSVKVTFTSDSTSNKGFQAVGYCASAYGMVGCPDVGSPLITTFPIVIGSDVDGQGSASYGGSDSVTCEWTLACPTGSVLMMAAALGHIDASTTIQARNGPLAPWATNLGGQSITSVSEFQPLAPNLTLQYIPTRSTTYRGFQMRFQCSPVLNDFTYHVGCRSAVDADIQTSAGYIGSDMDGDGWWPMSTSSDCRWAITCPRPTQSILPTKMSGTFNENSWMNFYDYASGRLSGVVNAGQKLSANWNQLPIANSLIVNSVTNAKAQYTDRGFELNYTCVDGPPYYYFGCPDGADNITAYPGVLGSDLDGIGATMYPASANCLWVVQCPVGMSVFINTITYDLGSGDSVVFLDYAPSERRSALLKNKASPQPQTASRNTLNLLFTSDNAQNYQPGFSMSWTCVAGDAYLGCPANETITTYPGVIGSDIDGYGGARYNPSGEQCSWTIMCPAGTLLVTNTFQYDLGSGDWVGMYSLDRDAVSQAYAGKTSANNKGSKVENATIGQGATFVSFSSTGNNDNPGWWLNYTCAPQRPNGVYSGPGVNYGLAGCPGNATITSYPGTIMSDLDGADQTMPYGTGAICQWWIQCPATHDLVLTYFEADIGQGSILYFLDGVTKVTTTSFTQDKKSNGFWDYNRGHIGSSIGIRMVTGNTNSGNGGFTLSYDCIPATRIGVDFRARMGCPKDEVTTWYPGAIGSDINGAGDGLMYANGQDCRWRLRCPLGKVLYIYTYSFGLSSDDFVQFADPRGSVNGQTLKQSWASASWRFATQSLDVIFHTGNNGVNKGFWINYTCVSASYDGMCPASADVMTGQGLLPPVVIQTDLDGTGNDFLPSNNQKCSWLLRCPPKKYLAVQSSDSSYGNAASGGSRPTFYTADDYASVPTTSDVIVEQMRYYNKTMFNTDGMTYMANKGMWYSANYTFASAAVFVLEVINDGGAGARLVVDCVDTPGFGLAPYGLVITDAGRGFLNSDVDGHKEGFLTHKTRPSNWRVQCPPRKVFTISQFHLSYSPNPSTPKWGIFFALDDSPGAYFSTMQRYDSNTFEQRTLVGVPLGTNVNVTFDPEGTAREGMLLEYQCLPGVALMGFPPNGVVGGFTNITIGTDVDGSGPIGSMQLTSTTGSARWNVICPRKTTPRILDFAMSTPNTGNSWNVQMKVQVFPVPTSVISAMDARLSTLIDGETDKDAVADLTWSVAPLDAALLQAWTPPASSSLLNQTGGASSLPAAIAGLFPSRAFVVTLQASNVIKALDGGFLMDVVCDCVPGPCPPLPTRKHTRTVALPVRTRTKTLGIYRTRTMTKMVLPTTAAATTQVPTSAPVVTTWQPTALPTTLRPTAAPNTTRPTLRPATVAPVLHSVTKTLLRLVPPPRRLTRTVVNVPATTTVAPTTAAPPPAAVAQAVVSNALGSATTQQTSQATTTAAAAAINPAVAAQTARAAVALQLAACAYDYSSQPAIMSSPAQLAITSDRTKWYVGAAILNVVIFGLIVAAHYGLALIFKRKVADVPAGKDRSPAAIQSYSLAKARFPGASVTFVSSFLMQPTVAAAVIVLRWGQSAVALAIGAVVSLVLLALFIGGCVLLKRSFTSTYAEVSRADTNGHGSGGGRRYRIISRMKNTLGGGGPVADAVVDYRPHASLNRHDDDPSEGAKQSLLSRFIDGNGGKWIDDPANNDASRFGYTKRYGLFFSMYRRGPHWFMAIEIGTSAAAGIMTGLQSDVQWQCNALLWASLIVQLNYVILLCIFRPYASPFDLVTFFLLGASQLVTSVVVMPFAGAVLSSGQISTVSGYCTVFTLYVAMTKAALDLIIQLYKFWERRKAKARREAALKQQGGGMTNLGSSLLATPLLSVPQPDAPASPINASAALSSPPAKPAQQAFGAAGPTAPLSPQQPPQQHPPSQPQQQQSVNGGALPPPWASPRPAASSNPLAQL